MCENRCSLFQVALILNSQLGAKLVKLFKKQTYFVKKVDYGVKKIYFMEKYEHKSRKKGMNLCIQKLYCAKYRIIIMLFVYFCLHFVALNAEKMTDEVLG